VTKEARFAAYWSTRSADELARALVDCEDEVTRLRTLLTTVNSDQTPESLADKTVKLTELLTTLCSTPDEAFKVLGHVTVALLQRVIETRGLKPPADEQLVATYLLEVAAGMERFGGPAVSGVADAAGATDLGDAGRNEPCPCGSGKKYKKCHGAG
jgi:uncharacterized protein YecA (UPF0149 family)